MLRRTEAALIGDEEGSRVFTVTSHKGTRFWHAGSPAVDSSGICFGCRNHLARSFPSWATLLWKLSIAAYKMLAQWEHSAPSSGRAGGVSVLQRRVFAGEQGAGSSPPRPPPVRRSPRGRRAGGRPCFCLARGCTAGSPCPSKASSLILSLVTEHPGQLGFSGAPRGWPRPGSRKCEHESWERDPPLGAGRRAAPTSSVFGAALPVSSSYARVPTTEGRTGSREGLREDPEGKKKEKWNRKTMNISRTSQAPCSMSPHFTRQEAFQKDQQLKGWQLTAILTRRKAAGEFKTRIPAVLRHLIRKQRHSELVGQVTSSARAKINGPPEESQSKVYYCPHGSGDSRHKSQL
ncbi:uncharacterized protein LOC106028729 [Cavia porcellus]|uniref:uncharacterized protein LOC106028729 n=1 Tax=Cavia porcellus TaxID=10141 RepID=UPI000C87A7C0|nr:uncharacterized protein LOC106028729 [Cavia porcellus]